MKVRIYKAGGGTGKFISKLDRFLPTAAEGAQVEQMKQLKEAIKYQLDDNNQSESSVVLQLVRGGYDYAYAKDIVDTIAEEIEDDYYSKKNKKEDDSESMMDSDMIPNEDELAEENQEREKRKAASARMVEDINDAEAAATEEDEDDAADFDEMLNEASPYEDLEEAANGMQVDNSKIQWPGMSFDLTDYKKGGTPNKKKFINSTVKKLKKAAEGMQKDPSMNEMPNPYGTIDNPLGKDLSPNKSMVTAIKGTAQNYVNEEAFKKQAEQMYNQQFMQPTGMQPMRMPRAEQGGSNDWSTNLHNYGEALSHQMPNMNMNAMNTEFDGQQMAFGGTSRRVRRANKGLFGVPIVPPGAKANYEFGPLGGVRKAQAEYDLGQIGELMKANPNLASMLMPQIAMGMPGRGGLWNRWTSNAPAFNPFGGGFNNFGGGYNSSYSYGTPKTRLSWATQTINNAADPAKNEESVKLNNNSNQTDQKKKYQDYIDWYVSLGTTPGMSKAAPVSFEEFITKGDDGSSEYDWWVKSRTSQTPGATTVNEKVEVQTTPGKSSTSSKSNTTSKSSTSKSSTSAKSSSTVKSNTPKSEPTVTVTNAAALNKANAPKATAPAKKKTVQSDEVDPWEEDMSFWDKVKPAAKLVSPPLTYFGDKIFTMFGYEDGGFVDFDRPDLNRFIYGGNEYAYGGGVQKFTPGGNVDMTIKDPAGRNYQQYIDWYNQTPLEKGMSRAAPQTQAEWNAENKPAASSTTPTANTGNAATTKYDQTYFQNMFKNDPAFKQGFETFMQSQGLPANNQFQQRQQQGNFQWTNRQGTPVVGYGPANQNFGSMLGRAFGLTKDFNYFTSPQGQITGEMISQMMQGKNPTGKVTQTQFKDRGKWFNPFDNKRVTEWTVDNGAGQGTSGANAASGNAPGYYPTAAGPGYSGYNADSDGNGQPDYLQVPNPQDQAGSGATNKAAATPAASGVPYNTAGPMNTGENTGIQEDFQPNQAAMDYMRQSLSVGQGNAAGQSTGQAASSGIDISNQGPSANVPNTGVNEDIPQDMYYQTAPGKGVDRQGALVSQDTPGMFQRLKDAYGNVKDMFSGKRYGEGGYIPSYMAYGGYMPDYGYGGYYPDGGSTVVGPNQDFAGVQQNNIAQDSDNNGIPDYLEVKDQNAGTEQPSKYRLEEQSAWTWDPKKTAQGVDQALRGATNIMDKISFAKSREQENPKYMYAQDVDRQLVQKGLGDPNEGIWKQNIGFESGRTYASKYGGAKFAKGGSQYSKGKVYSLTMDEINEIKRRGGSVKFIK